MSFKLKKKQHRFFQDHFIIIYFMGKLFKNLLNPQKDSVMQSNPKNVLLAVVLINIIPIVNGINGLWTTDLN